MNLYVGTSGYAYKQWKGAFYPEDLPDIVWILEGSQISDRGPLGGPYAPPGIFEEGP